MKRSAALGLALFAVLRESAAGAQQTGKTYRVGVLVDSAANSDSSPDLGAFLRTLAGLGFVEGKNLEITFRSATNYKQLPELAAALVRAKPDALVVSGAVTIAAARRATSSVPIVMTGNPDPVAYGFVASLARPGGNVTGVENMGADISGKELQLMRELVPHLQRVAVLLNFSNPSNPVIWRSAASVARSHGIQISAVDVRSSDQIDVAFKSIQQLHPDALMVLNDGMILNNAARVVQLAAARRLPAVYGLSQFTGVGGLMSYGASSLGLWVQVATYVARILKGANPAELPIERPTTFELILNLKTAHSLGITVPQSILLQATQVIR